MSTSPDDPEPRAAEPEIVVSTRGDGFAYVRDRVIVWGDDTRERVTEFARRERRAADARRITAQEPWFAVEGVGDPVTLVDTLRSEGRVAQPDHVLFAHSCGCCAPTWANPCGCGGGRGTALAANPFSANPFSANPFSANPFSANPFSANPFSANARPLRANPFSANRPMENTARPAEGRELPIHEDLARAVRILVLDTGVASPDAGDPWTKPELLSAAAGRVDGDGERPDTIPPLGDESLDPVAGHGTFIAGLIEQLAPGCEIRVHGVTDALGRVLESRVVTALEDEARSANPADLVSMSFGGQLMQSFSPALRAVVALLRRRGVVLVASAGNDATCVPQFPAAFEDVVAVGALATCGPAPFTNWGDWVDACAPGVDLVSTFFDGFDGRNPAVNGVDIDHFTGWARWSGTSFAGPVVVAALARDMARSGGTGDEAVEHVIRARHLFRLPCLGTVVNL